MCCLSNIRNDFTPKHVQPGQNNRAENERVKYYRVLWLIIPSQNDHSKLYICTTKIIEKLTSHRKKLV